MGYKKRATREVEKLAYIFQFNGKHAGKKQKRKHFVTARGPELKSENNLISIFCLSLTISVANVGEWTA